MLKSVCAFRTKCCRPLFVSSIEFIRFGCAHSQHSATEKKKKSFMIRRCLSTLRAATVNYSRIQQQRKMPWQSTNNQRIPLERCVSVGAATPNFQREITLLMMPKQINAEIQSIIIMFMHSAFKLAHTQHRAPRTEHYTRRYVLIIYEMHRNLVYTLLR